MKNYKSSVLGIKSWAEEDRPREKLLLKGKQNLTDAELLAIVLGSGSRNETAVGLAQRMLGSAENNLEKLSRLTLKELMTFKGVGEAKAVTLAAVMELGRRRQLTDVKEKPQLRSSRDAYDTIGPVLIDLVHEEFWILLLNRANRIISKEQISKGGTAGTVVDAKIVFRIALEKQASSMILCHNHPSGNLRASQADLALTKKLVEAGKQLDIMVLDHLIVTQSGYLSFADEGMM
ncbi:MAG: DNA repair protein RadC [Saprospiraceae bacterium]|nr:DNA repair protein RadC [Saprospiraceae bacterium]MCB9326135.1 DNA repair protein RadC [Lewinellaceae bacterium]